MKTLGELRGAIINAVAVLAGAIGFAFCIGLASGEITISWLNGTPDEESYIAEGAEYIDAVESDEVEDSPYLDEELLDKIRKTDAYKQGVESLGHIADFGIRASNSVEHIDGYSIIFQAVNTDVIFYVDVYKEKVENLNVHWAECWDSELGGYVVLDGPSCGDSDDTVWVRWDNGIPLSSLRMYRAMARAGITGKYSSDYKYEYPYPSVVNLYDIDTGEAKYCVKFEDNGKE